MAIFSWPKASSISGGATGGGVGNVSGQHSCYQRPLLWCTVYVLACTWSRKVTLGLNSASVDLIMEIRDVQDSNWVISYSDDQVS